MKRAKEFKVDTSQDLSRCSCFPNQSDQAVCESITPRFHQAIINEQPSRLAFTSTPAGAQVVRDRGPNALHLCISLEVKNVVID